MDDRQRARIASQEKRMASLARWRNVCGAWLGCTFIFGPLIFLLGLGGVGSNTGGVFPSYSIVLPLVGTPLSLMISGTALWFFSSRYQSAQAEFIRLRKEANQPSTPAAPSGWDSS